MGALVFVPKLSYSGRDHPVAPTANQIAEANRSIIRIDHEFNKADRNQARSYSIAEPSNLIEDGRSVILIGHTVEVFTVIEDVVGDILNPATKGHSGMSSEDCVCTVNVDDEGLERDTLSQAPITPQSFDVILRVDDEKHDPRDILSQV